MARLLPPLGLVAGLAAAAVVLAASFRAVADPDFFWHLAAGRLIATTRALPASDPFTFAAQGQHWVMHEWLFEVWLWGVYGVGGPVLVSLLLGAVSATAFLLLALRIAPASGRTPAAVAAMLAALVSFGVLGPRVQMVTLAFSALVLWLLDRDRRVHDQVVWITVPLVALWANLHGGFVIVLLWTGAHAVAASLAGSSRAGRLWALTGALAPAGCLTPYGALSPWYAVTTQFSSAQQTVIAEWQSPNFHLLVYQPLLLLLLASVPLFAAWRRPRWLELALFVVTALMALRSLRHIPLFAVAGAPALTMAACDARDRWREWVAARASAGRRLRAPGAPETALLVISAWVVLGGTLASMLLPLAAHIGPRAQAIELAGDQPVGVTDYLATLAPGRILNQYEFGGYLAYRLEPLDARWRIYIFGDAALMGDDLLLEYTRAFDLGPGYGTILRQRQPRYIVSLASSPLAQLLVRSGKWRELHHDQLAVVLERTGPDYV
ncbi:MAG: hypothetical protein ACYDAY_02635 [Candidatus Dormibacteria bacterium]